MECWHCLYLFRMRCNIHIISGKVIISHSWSVYVHQYTTCKIYNYFLIKLKFSIFMIFNKQNMLSLSNAVKKFNVNCYYMTKLLTKYILPHCNRFFSFITWNIYNYGNYTNLMCILVITRYIEIFFDFACQ